MKLARAAIVMKSPVLSWSVDDDSNEKNKKMNATTTSFINMKRRQHVMIKSLFQFNNNKRTINTIAQWD